MTSNNRLYPLTFSPLLKRLVWGGRKLRSLGKTLPDEQPIGEVWEIVDLPGEQSVVDAGDLAGTTLSQLVDQHASALLGPVPLDGGRFPLLVKYIDAAKTLSVQVHPDEAATARMGHGRPKNEAWYILAAEPDAVLYLGLKPGTTRAQLEAAISDCTLERLLVTVPARPGMLVPIKPGTLHAIGGGVLLAEVQQPSDTTYRVYDWGRVGLDGRPRELHVAEALECTKLDAQVSLSQRSLDAGHFRVQILELASGERRAVGGKGPRILVGLSGSAQLAADHVSIALGPGRVTLIPHCCSDPPLRQIEPGALLLVSFR